MSDGTEAPETPDGTESRRMSMATSPSRFTNVFPHSLSGTHFTENVNSVSWSENGLLAYGCQNKILVVETKGVLKVCQTLYKHKYIVKVVKWMKDNSFTLLSADSHGNIVIWDAAEGSILSVVTSESKEMKHLHDVDWIKIDVPRKGREFHVLALYGNNQLILYDRETGDVIWKKSLGHPLQDDYYARSFCVDPFNKASLAFALQPSAPSNLECCFAVAKDISQLKFQIKRYQIYLANNADASPGSPVRVSSASKLQHYVKDVGVGLSKTTESTVISKYVLEYAKIVYNSAVRGQLFVMCSREIILIDVNFDQVLTVIPIERNASNVVDLYSCAQRNVLICLHEQGTVSVRLLQKKFRYEEQVGANVMNVHYATVCLSDGVRLTKSSKVVGFSVNPISEANIALLMSNARVFALKLHRKFAQKRAAGLSLNEIVTKEDYQVKDAGVSEERKFSLIMMQWLNSISNCPHVIRMCPPLTLRNWDMYKPYLAVGDSSGNIQIYNASTCLIEKELSIHSSPVRGLEWVSLSAFLSFAHPNISGSSGRVSNELFLCDINSGRFEAVRTEKNAESSPIEMLKVSCLKQYFILGLKSEPFEIWDLKTLTLLRVMTKQSPFITAVEWSPLYNKKFNAESSDQAENSEVKANIAKDKKRARIKENFVVTNTNSELHHFSVEGTVVKQVSSTPDLNGPIISSIAWKSDLLVLGDVDGNLNVWHLKDKVTKVECTNRGWIKKLRFGPGRGNMKCLVLFNDGVDIWDIKDLKVTAQLKHPRDISAKIQDIDWAGSDRPVLALSDDSILVTDLKLKQFNSPVAETYVDELPSSLNLSTLLQTNLHMLSPKNRLAMESAVLHNRFEGEDLLPESDLDRYLLHARLLGNKRLINFWELVRHHLTNEKGYCDTNYEFFLDLDAFKEMQNERVALYESLRETFTQNQLCVERHIWLGNYERAIQLLLETDPREKDTYFKDSLKACLISLLTSMSKESQTASCPVVKLVATNLIANESINEGVQLLSLIGKAKDACRYLQSSGQWEESLIIAKLHLKDTVDGCDVLNAWIKHLEQAGSYDLKLYALLSMKFYDEVIDYILKSGEVEKASLFATLLQKNNLLSEQAKSSVETAYKMYVEKLRENEIESVAKEYEQRILELVSS